MKKYPLSLESVCWVLRSRRSYGQTNMARSTWLLTLIKNIYTLYSRKRFLLPVTYFSTNLVYPFTLRVTRLKISAKHCNTLLKVWIWIIWISYKFKKHFQYSQKGLWCLPNRGTFSLKILVDLTRIIRQFFKQWKHKNISCYFFLNKGSCKIIENTIRYIKHLSTCWF